MKRSWKASLAISMLSASLLVGTSTTSDASVVVAGLDGLEFMAFGPGGAFGDELYLATLGTDSTRGAVYTLARDRTLKTFMSNIDASSVAFDIDGVLGGGMFVADLGRHGTAGTIYRVLPGADGEFHVSLFADFSSLPGAPRRKPLALNMLISDGSAGFAPGLYVTSGPAPDERSDKLIHVDANGVASIVKDGFAGNEAIVFAEGAYGNGMLITVPYAHSVVRLLPDGTLSEFAELPISSFGPAGLAYGADGFLYTTTFTGGEVLKLMPDGSSQFVARLAVASGGGSKGIVADHSGIFCEAMPRLLVGTFTIVSDPQGLDAVHCIPEPSALLLAAGSLGVLIGSRRRQVRLQAGTLTPVGR